ncbi:hypothetical protein BC941DRAFT_431227 [Chlamydoabsidia padenii]|nr:hypothetical protein BC941DRAFT_431227 [Chlamydoabsidia padenii]
MPAYPLFFISFFFFSFFFPMATHMKDDHQVIDIPPMDTSLQDDLLYHALQKEISPCGFKSTPPRCLDTTNPMTSRRPPFTVVLLRLVISCLIILVFIALSAYLCKIVDRYCFGHTSPWSGPSWFWLDGFYLLGGSIVVALGGLAFMVWLCCVTQPAWLIQFDDDDDSVSLLCCNQSTLPWYCFYLIACVYGGGGGVILSLLMIAFGVMGAIMGMYRLIQVYVNPPPWQ